MMKQGHAILGQTKRIPSPNVYTDVSKGFNGQMCAKVNPVSIRMVGICWDPAALTVLKIQLTYMQMRFT